MRYYYHPFSPNCRKTTAVLESLGLAEERIVVDLPKGEQLTPEVLAVNPNGMVPALTDMPLGCRFNNRCPHADDGCLAQDPPMADSGGGQLVACHKWRELEAAG